MPVRSVTACDNSRVITGSTMPSLLIHSDRGVYGVAMPPAMPAPIAGETVALFAAAPDMLAALAEITRLVNEYGHAADVAKRCREIAETAVAKAEGKL